MKKNNKIIYWIATIWLSLGMLSTAIVQLAGTDDEVSKMTALGYPTYLLILIGIWKVLGVIAVLVPGLPVIKEWAYAGFFIVMSGAIVSHMFSGSEVKEFFGPTLLLVLTVISWYTRPGNRKPIIANQNVQYESQG